LNSQSGQEIERIGFSPSFELNGGGNIERYYIAADSIDVKINILKNQAVA